MSEINDFLAALKNNPEAMKMIREAKEPDSLDEAVGMYVDIVEKAGVSVSKETLRTFFAGKIRSQMEAAQKADSDIKKALDETDLDSVAGGGIVDCNSTFEPGEWCWFSDVCSMVISTYEEANIPYKAADDLNLGSDTYTYITETTFSQWENLDEVIIIPSVECSLTVT